MRARFLNRRAARTFVQSAALGLAAAIAVGVPATAQVPVIAVREAADTRETRALVAELTRVSRASNDRLAAQRKTWLDALPLDTLDLAGVRWYVAPAARRDLEAIVQRLDSIVRHRGLPPFRELLGTGRAWVVAGVPPTGYWGGYSRMITFDTSASQVSPLPSLGRDVLARVIGQQLAVGAMRQVDRRMTGFLQTAIPLDANGGVGAVDMRTALINTGDRRGPACAGADLAACESMLFDPGMNAVVGGAPRGGLARVALDLGGPGAWRILLADTAAPPRERLAAAAGRPIREVLARWHAEELALPDSTSTLPVLVVVALSALSAAIGLRRAH